MDGGAEVESETEDGAVEGEETKATECDVSVRFGGGGCCMLKTGA